MKALDSAEVVIIGGGCVGTSAAWHLARAGVTDVVLVEGDYLGAGATGRCGGGIRQQWSSAGNVRLAKLSIGEFRSFAADVGQDIEFDQGGYLLTAWTDAMVADLHRDIALQNSCGVNTRWVAPEEAARIAPMISVEGMFGAAYGPTDGKANPFLVVKGYSERARELGARIHTRTRVTGLEVEGDAVGAVLTDRGRVVAKWVINAAGAHAAEIAAMAGAQVPVVPYRHQILVTEPVAPCHDPMVIDLHHNIYFCQARCGQFIFGQGDEGEPPGTAVGETWRFPLEIARKVKRLAPRLLGLGVLRQWAGLYDMTPDRQPIIGRVSRHRNFLMAAGFSGHGFMLSPGTGRLVAEMVVHGEARSVDAKPYSIERFRGGDLAVEKDVV